MSQAQTSRTVHFQSKMGSYTVDLVANDLYQEYKGSWTNPEAVWPNFAVERPEIELVITSSRVVENPVTPNGVAWYINTQPITAAPWASLVEAVSPTRLRIKGNLVEQSGGAAIQVKAVAGVTFGTTSDSLTAVLNIPISLGGTDAYRARIVSADDKNFVIRAEGESCQLRALLMRGATTLTDNLSYKWYKYGSGAWNLLSTETSQVLTVQEADVDTYANYMVEIYEGGVLRAADACSVMDLQDPLDIDPCPSPADEIIEEGNNNRSSVTYTPKVVVRGSNTTPAEFQNCDFLFMVRDAAGVVLNEWHDGFAGVNNLDPMDLTTSPLKSYMVTERQCVQAGGDVTIIIEAISNNS